MTAEDSRRARRVVAMTKARDELVATLNETDLGEIVANIRDCHDLGSIGYHFGKHGALLGATTEEEYLGLLRSHLKRGDLEFYAHRRKDGQLMWYAVSVDTQEVAQYNASKGQLWSYYFDEDFAQFAHEGGLVRIAREAHGWRAER